MQSTWLYGLKLEYVKKSENIKEMQSTWLYGLKFLAVLVKL